MLQIILFTLLGYHLLSTTSYLGEALNLNYWHFLFIFKKYAKINEKLPYENLKTSTFVIILFNDWRLPSKSLALNILRHLLIFSNVYLTLF